MAYILKRKTSLSLLVFDAFQKRKRRSRSCGLWIDMYIINFYIN